MKGCGGVWREGVEGGCEGVWRVGVEVCITCEGSRWALEDEEKINVSMLHKMETCPHITT